MHIFKHANFNFLRWRWHAIAASWVIILAGVFTLDQRLTKHISFFAEGFYSNRRGNLLDAPNQTPTSNVAIAGVITLTVRTVNSPGIPR